MQDAFVAKLDPHREPTPLLDVSRWARERHRRWNWRSTRRGTSILAGAPESGALSDRHSHSGLRLAARRDSWPSSRRAAMRSSIRPVSEASFTRKPSVSRSMHRAHAYITGRAGSFDYPTSMLFQRRQGGARAAGATASSPSSSPAGDSLDLHRHSWAVVLFRHRDGDRGGTVSGQRTTYGADGLGGFPDRQPDSSDEADSRADAFIARVLRRGQRPHLLDLYRRHRHPAPAGS